MFKLIGLFLCLLTVVAGCSTLSNTEYDRCVRRVENPDTVVWFAITENNKTDEYCRCIEKGADKAKCWHSVLRNL